MIDALLEDGFFAAIAAIGFASISNPPKRLYLYCGLVAAAGHSLRYLLTAINAHIIVASSLAALLIGVLSLLVARRVKCPAESCIFPALLPMIPGMYAYRAISALVLCLSNHTEDVFNHNLYLLAHNGFTCVFIIVGMVVCAMMPIFLMKKVAFQATR